MKHQTRFIISWTFIAISIIWWMLAKMHGAFILMVIGILFRDPKLDIPFWKDVGTKKTAAHIIIFTWMLIWLAYIMFGFYSSDPIGTFKLSEIEWGLFMVPFAFLFTFYEISLYKRYKNV